MRRAFSVMLLQQSHTQTELQEPGLDNIAKVISRVINIKGVVKFPWILSKYLYLYLDTFKMYPYLYPDTNPYLDIFESTRISGSVSVSGYIYIRVSVLKSSVNSGRLHCMHISFSPEITPRL